MKCNICSVEDFVFRCNYCNQFFCSEHRLPINHECIGINQYLENRKKSISYDRLHKNNPYHSITQILHLHFSKTEIKHLLIATFLVTLVGMSLNNYRYISIEFLVIFIIAFLFHELAHKFLANFYGSWAEFRTQIYGLIITAISAMPFMPFKFIAPGAVMVGISETRKLGKVALIGPVTNIIMGFVLLTISYQYPYLIYLNIGASFNAWIAMFNLLPFGVLDGQKIFNWNKMAWLFTMAVTMILFIVSYL